FTDSLQPPNWTTAVDFVPGTGNIVTAIHLGGAGQPSRFYRVRLLTSSDLAPAASFTGGPTSGQIPLTVSFADTSAGYITNRFWDFGDGSTTNTPAATVVHTYTAPGSNTVTLTATGPAGSSTQTRPNYIVAIAQLLITSIQTSGSNVLIAFTSSAGQFYRVEYTDTLSPPNWTTAVDFVPGTGGIVTAIHLGGASQPSRFYRVRLLTGSDLAPAANFTGSPTSGQVTLKVTLAAGARSLPGRSRRSEENTYELQSRG